MTHDEERFYVRVGKRIHARRKLLGMTLEQVAEGVGTRFQRVQKWESAHNRISIYWLIRLARVLAVDHQWFLDS